MDGSFWVGCNKQCSFIPMLDPNFRSLKDILSTMQQGLPAATPPLHLIHHQKGEPKLFMSDGVAGHSLLLPYGKADSTVFTLSVFGRGPDWITHALSTEEVAAAYNLPVHLQKHRWLDIALPFLNLIPNKVLMAFWNDILRTTGEVETRRLSEPLSDPTLVPEPALQETETRMDRDKLTACLGTTVSGIAFKASKADDADIDKWLWDSLMVRDFPQLNKLTADEVGSVNETLRCSLVTNWKSRLRLEGLEYL
jgi:hypothetical protein